MFVQGVLPGSTAEMCDQVNSGDQILAIDGQLLDGADYLMYNHSTFFLLPNHVFAIINFYLQFNCRANKYLKQAEDDVSLVLVPKHS